MAGRQGSDIHHPQFTTRGDGGRVLQGSVHQRRYPSKVPDAAHMKLPVTLDNYKAKFTALLYYEELEHIELLKKKCDGCYTLKKCQPPSLRYDEEDYPDNFYCLEGMSSAQIMYATQASDRHVTFSIGQRSYIASILSCNYSDIDNKLYICFNQRGESINSIRVQFPLKVNVTFDVNHSYFVGLNEGVTRISMNVLRRLIPIPEDFKSPPKNISINIRRHPHGGIDLDPEQYPALEAILSNQCSAPVLVPGAFGCGKTRLLAVATECFFREHRETGHPSPCRILICCHHQHSADVFMDSYFNKMLTYKKHPWPVKVVRVTSSRHRVDYPGYVQAARFNNSPYKDETSFLLVTTFGGALTISRRVEPDFFTHILIDEGAQTREPEALSPFLMANENTRIVIAGDHQQVGPQLLVLGKAPQQFGLCVSLLQRLLEKYKSIGDITKRNTPSWNINYRSQAGILELPSKLFYNSELKDCVLLMIFQLMLSVL
ncbi:PREDICTED: probable helicase with zinc finger domain [Amphimedon queenslandica]|uniref:DNA2/NAM7 helicase helicase domain-containing protein n=1 Tax=Amphimedon queenslandica TaxID=400682 RepID=A0AAN0JHY1_AMPQE|nr:PREDICTED: probable helicase with zinc finger domain [Amphimedon queenslandica]|eukprot:XP_019856640.1 PREDICTED: probable helicase with zinc finger domain [Amphimedon queenslandica]